MNTQKNNALFKKLFSIEEGIFLLFEKKYNENYYCDSLSHNFIEITKKEVIDNIIINNKYNKDKEILINLVNRYNNLEENLCNYDIDIIQLILILQQT